MRQRSKTNSRHEENAGLRQRYAACVLNCELAEWIPQFRVNDNPFSKADETNHIFGGTSGRHDSVTNLIRLSVENHRWFHRFPADGRVCCLWVKHQKGQIDEAEFREASGVYIAGWLLCAQSKIRHEFVRPLLLELMREYP